MKYSVDKSKKEKLYMQLYYALREDITRGVYPYGSKLPSKRLLAEEAEVSVISVMHAYDILSDEGYIEPCEKSGYYVVFRERDFSSAAPARGGYTEAARTKPEGDGSGYSFPYATLARTMRKVISERGELLLERSPNEGVYALRDEISRYLARSCGIAALPERIIIGAGAEYLYDLVLLLLGRTRIYGIEYPSYEKIEQVYRANGVKTDRLPLLPDGIDASALARSPATVLHVTPFNSYPSHYTASASKRRLYLSWAEERDGYIIEDNYDSELTPSKKHEDTLFSMSDRVVYVNTFSRTVSPSLRVGYAILPERLEKAFHEKLGFYSCAVPTFEQYVLCELIAGGLFERHINRVRRSKRRDQK